MGLQRECCCGPKGTGLEVAGKLEVLSNLAIRGRASVLRKRLNHQVSVWGGACGDLGQGLGQVGIVLWDDGAPLPPAMGRVVA